MDPTLPFLADERARQLRRDAEVARAAVRARHRLRRRRFPPRR
ncbi:MAG TPA: hypothetical protein VIL48_14810 [Acidimicrobiales bacterium]